MTPQDTGSMTDEYVVSQIKLGNKEYFGVLMERYDAKLTRYGKKFLSDPENIYDMVQDVFIKTYKNIQSFDQSQKFSSWIYRIAHNTFINCIKKNSHNPFLYFDLDALIAHPSYKEPEYEDPHLLEEEQKEIKALIDKGLENISPQYKEVLVLYYIEDLSYKEIADILRIPTGTVGIRMKRAKESLKKHIWKTKSNTTF